MMANFHFMKNFFLLIFLKVFFEYEYLGLTVCCHLIFVPAYVTCHRTVRLDQFTTHDPTHDRSSII